MAYSIGIFDKKSSNNPAQLQRQARKLNFACHFTLQSVNNKDADETALMHRLICAFAIFMKKKCIFVLICQAHYFKIGIS